MNKSGLRYGDVKLGVISLQVVFRALGLDELFQNQSLK